MGRINEHFNPTPAPVYEPPRTQTERKPFRYAYRDDDPWYVTTLVWLHNTLEPANNASRGWLDGVSFGGFSKFQAATDPEFANRYHINNGWYMGGRIGGELAQGVVTGGLAKSAGYIGKAAFALDTGMNAHSFGSGVVDAYQSGRVNWSNGLQMAAGAAGLSGNAFGALRGASSVPIPGAPVRAPADLPILNSSFTPNQTVLNKVTAYDFYTGQGGFSPSRALQHMRGIDFSQPVDVVTIPHGSTAIQHVFKGQVGQYFTSFGTSAESVGISSVDRVPMLFQSFGELPALRSTAAGIPDFRTGVPTTGGGTQFFVPSPHGLVPITSTW